jgi:ABC-type glycerol-3-phosphate transport system substrate-binding protein
MKAKNWYYRKDLFEKAGLDLNAIKTLDDYMAAGKKYHQVHPKSFIMNIGPQPIHYWYFMILSHWEDVRVADKDGNYQVTKNPHFKDLFNWLKTWKTSGISFNTDDWSQDWQPAFADSTIGGDLVSNWMNSFLPKYAPDQKGLWGLALWPEFNRTGSEAGGSVVVIPKGAKNPDAAFEFASKMFLDPKGAVYNFQSGGNPGATKAGQDAIREITASMKTKPADMKDDDWKVAPVNFFGVDFMDPINKALEVLKVFPYDPKAQAELDILRKHCEAFIADKETLDQALAGAEGDMKAQLGNPYKL